jgi:hypothetical protein
MATATATTTAARKGRKRSSARKTSRVTVSAAVARSAREPGDALWTTPVVIRRQKRGKRRKKKKYSRGTKGFQRFGLGLAEGAQRLADGLSRGERNYVRRTKRSGRKKRDGMARDFVRNFTRGFGKGSRRASKAPRDVAKRFNSRQAWRVIRLATPFA